MKSHTSRCFWWSTILTLALVGMTAAQVKVDWDRSADFTKYTTYAWAAGTPAKNQLINQSIVQDIDQNLQAKGLQKVDSPMDADLVVMYHAATDAETGLNTTGMGWGWRWGGTSTTTTDKMPVGQLTVDIGDAKTRQLLWMGSASGTLSDDPDKTTQKINEVVADMFKKFPPGTKY